MIRKISSLLVLVVFVLSFSDLFAAEHVESASLRMNPQSGSFVEGSTFEASLYLDTGNYTVNTVDIQINFPANLLQVVEVSTGLSIFSSWTVPPALSNTNGKVTFRGGIMPGVKTSQGLISTLIFRVVSAGEATVSIDQISKVLASDGKGTNILTSSNAARYTLQRSLASGPSVSSPTHLQLEQFSNNGTVAFMWSPEQGVTGYSHIFDHNPTTVPDNVIDTNETSVQFPDTTSGVWYFHIKQEKAGIWSDISHAQVRIDTQAPHVFIPDVVRTGMWGKASALMFETSDALSGISYYQVAVIDESTPNDISPVFFETKSPYHFPDSLHRSGRSVTVVVRAFDNAGNIRDAQVRVQLQTSWSYMLRSSPFWIGFSGFLALAGVVHFIRKHAHRVAQQRAAAAYATRAEPPNEV